VLHFFDFFVTIVLRLEKTGIQIYFDIFLQSKKMRNDEVRGANRRDDGKLS